MDVKVSVIIPVYNEEKYISECLDSVINQTLKDIEILCVDDGSTDNSVQIIKRYCDSYPWITLIGQENKGAGAARNNGMAHAKGQFLCFLDADDYYISRTALEVLYNTAVEEKVDICAGLVQIEVEGKIEKNSVLRDLLGRKDKVHVSYQDFQYDYQYTCYLYSRDLLNRYKVAFPDYRRFQDPPFLVQALYYAQEFAVARSEFYFYRRGCRKTKFTDEEARGLFEGLLFNLSFANYHNLQKLFRLTVSRINHDYFDVLYNALNSEVQGLKDRFAEADKLVTGRNLFLEPFELYLLKEGEHRVNILFETIQKKIDRNTNIIIYGAGDKGKKCVLYLKNTGYAGIAMWVDHYRHGTVSYSEKIYDLKDISSVAYDKLLIAVEDRNISGEIKQSLSQQGIAGEKIIEWCDKQDRRVFDE